MILKVLGQRTFYPKYSGTKHQHKGGAIRLTLCNEPDIEQSKLLCSMNRKLSNKTCFVQSTERCVINLARCCSPSFAWPTFAWRYEKDLQAQGCRRVDGQFQGVETTSELRHLIKRKSVSDARPYTDEILVQPPQLEHEGNQKRLHPLFAADIEGTPRLHRVMLRFFRAVSVALNLGPA